MKWGTLPFYSQNWLLNFFSHRHYLLHSSFSFFKKWYCQIPFLLLLSFCLCSNLAASTLLFSSSLFSLGGTFSLQYLLLQSFFILLDWWLPKPIWIWLVKATDFVSHYFDILPLECLIEDQSISILSFLFRHCHAASVSFRPQEDLLYTNLSILIGLVITSAMFSFFLSTFFNHQSYTIPLHLVIAISLIL